MYFTLCLLLSILIVVNAQLPDPKTILQTGSLAGTYYISHNNIVNGCGWERGTFFLGLVKLYNALVKMGIPNADYLPTLMTWANHYNWALCPDDLHNPNNQLCGATYIELYLIDGKKNASWIKNTTSVIDTEVNGQFNQKWTWVDTLFMSMNTYIRLYEVYNNDDKYAKEMGKLFTYASVNEKFWNQTEGLWYRDGGFVGTDVYWSRGDGWAIGALTDTLRLLNSSFPDYNNYLSIFKQNAAKLKSIQGKDGCWRSSLLDPIDYPTRESTGTSLFTYAMAFGINHGFLSSTEYLPVVENAWQCLSKLALQPSGLFGYCQGVGSEPDKNIQPNGTSDFCVGQFLMASVEVATLAAKLTNNK